MDLTVSVYDALGKRCYFNQIKCDSEGKYYFTFDFSGNVKGQYRVEVIAKDKIVRPFVF